VDDIGWRAWEKEEDVDGTGRGSDGRWKCFVVILQFLSPLDGLVWDNKMA
jgi:hypothetical protein